MAASSKRSTSLGRLAALQRDALRHMGRDRELLSARAEREGKKPSHVWGLEADRLAAKHGFEALGCGSTRLAVAADCVWPGAVAKVAFEPRGLVYNLNEAALWITLPDEIKTHLAPALGISPQLVCLMERLEPVVPSLVDLARGPADAFACPYDDGEESITPEHIEAVATVQERIGQGRPVLIRANNHGVRPGTDGHFVLCDYGERWPAPEPTWAWLVGELQARRGLQPLDDDAQREHWAWVLDEIDSDRLHSALDPRPSFLSLMRRAGFRLGATSTQSCLCGSGRPLATCVDDDCVLNVDAALFMTRSAHLNDEVDPIPNIAGRIAGRAIARLFAVR